MPHLQEPMELTETVSPAWRVARALIIAAITVALCVFGLAIAVVVVTD